MEVIKKFKWPVLHHDQLETGELHESVYILLDDETIGHKAKDTEGLISVSFASVTFKVTKDLWRCRMINTPIYFELEYTNAQASNLNA